MQRHDRPTTTAAGLTILVALMALGTTLLALPSPAQAAPRHHHGLTIVSTPDPITAGAGVLIYGQLTGPNNAGRPITLFHRVAPAARFTPVSVTRTNGSGFYEFIRADGVVTSNRNWFVLGPGETRSRTIHEWVFADVTLAADTATATTAQTVTFSGTVSPGHPNERVLLQAQSAANGNGWQTIAAGTTDASSGFSVVHRFRSAGSYTLRALLPNDPRNLASPSASLSLTVQQEQNPSFTISGSAPVLTNGQSETVSGTLYADGSTSVTQPNVTVTLYGREGTGSFRALQTTQTNGSGAYSFTTIPLHNTVYYASAGRHERTAPLYVGVQDVVSAALAPASLAVGDAVKVTGTVTPDHTGHVLYLQQQDATGHWVDVETGYVRAGSTFAFRYTPGVAGTFALRVQITGGPWNVGGVSSTLALTVSGAAPVASLPPAP